MAGMAPVSLEGFQERVRAQRALAEPESKGAATYCTVCSKKFASFKAYENHLRSRRHVELEKQAVSRKVALMNEKNLEKGLGVDFERTRKAIHLKAGENFLPFTRVSETSIIQRHKHFTE